MIRLVLQVRCYDCGDVDEAEFDPDLHDVPDALPETLEEEGWTTRDGEHFCPCCSCDHDWVTLRATQQCSLCGRYQFRPVENVDLLKAVGHG